MTNFMKLTGLMATLVLMLIIPLYMWAEPSMQEDIIIEYQLEAISGAVDVYAQNCAICHGSSGEGILDFPALNSEGIRGMPEEELFKIIERGRPGTQMAGWAVDEGGILSHTDVDDLVMMLRSADWRSVEMRIADLGLTPPEITVFEVDDAMIAALSALPDGALLSEGLVLYADTCSACHGPDGSGTVIAPSLSSDELRAQPVEELVRIINYGVGGTLMAGWQDALSGTEIDTLVSFILRLPEVQQSGIEFPEAEMAVIPSSPEMIASGDRLFHIACKSCHGVDAYGSPMAPALNDAIFLGETPDAAIYQIIFGGVSETLMPAWGSRLSVDELQSLVVYLRSLEDPNQVIFQP